MSLFDPPSLSAEAAATAAIDIQVRNAARSLKLSYKAIRAIVYKNGTLTPDQVYAAFAENTTTGLSVDQLGEAARLIKATLNLFAPGTINDDVPEASIDFGT